MRCWRNWLGAAAALVLAFSTGCGEIGERASADVLLPERKVIALTFDDGPGRATTERLLDGLQQRGATATFFLVGELLEGQEELVRRMAREGHQIGNHTWSHARLPENEPQAILEEIRRCQEALWEILEEEDPAWLRPPYGLLEGVEGIEVPIIRWSIDPRDWESRDREAITAHVLRYARPGAIILLHDIYDTSVDAALEIVDRLQAEGYTFVTVEELLALYGVVPEAGQSYRSGDGVAAE